MGRGRRGEKVGGGVPGACAGAAVDYVGVESIEELAAHGLERELVNGQAPQTPNQPRKRTRTYEMGHVCATRGRFVAANATRTPSSRPTTTTTPFTQTWKWKECTNA